MHREGFMSMINRPRFILFAVIFFCCLGAGLVRAAETPAAGDKDLLDAYKRIEAKLAKSSFGIPLYLESSEGSKTIRVDTYSVVGHPFAGMRDVLLSPANWCDIASLHLNVKACTCKNLNGNRQLTLYHGRKFYQAQEDAYPVIYHYRVNALDSGHLGVSLAADQGPLSVKDLRLNLEAIPLDDNRTFIHLSCSCSYGFFTELALKSYFATLGRNKVGFSVVGTDSKGNPEYVGSLQGAIERTAVRYYLAVLSYMDSLRFPEEQRFEQRISRWYDLTSQFPKQLFEMKKESYLEMKRQEHKNN